MEQEPAELRSIRERLDELDIRMLAVLVERAHLINEVIAIKRTNGLTAVDASREEDMLATIVSVSRRMGLDPRIAQKVLRSVIDAFSMVETEQLPPPSPS